MHIAIPPKQASWLAALGVLALAPMANALEITADAQLTTEYTSNTLRTETDEEGEWIFAPGVDLTATQETADLQVDVDYSYLRRMYQKDFWQDEDRLLGGADVRWEAIDSRVDFIFRQNRRESSQRARDVQTQDNRQIVSTTEAGSTLRFQPRTGDELQVEYTFTDIRTDETRTDSQRHNGTGRYLLGLSENRTITLAGSYSDIDYDSAFFSSAEYAVASIGYTQTSNDVDLDVRVGYNWYERSERGSTDDPAFDAAITWRATPGTTFTVSGSRRITDQSQSLSQRGESVDENSDLNAAFEETLGQVSWTQVLGRTNSLTLSAYYGMDDYAEDVPRDNDRVGVRANFERAMTPRTSLNLYMDLSNRDYEDEGDDQDEIRAGINVAHRIGRSLTVNVGARYEERDAAASSSYDEWVGTVQLLYRFWGAR